MAGPILASPAPTFLTELHASRVYTRAISSHPSGSTRRRPQSFSSEAAFFETSSFGSSLTLLDSKASTHPSSQSTIYVAPLTRPSAADHSVDAALYSFRPPSTYSISSTVHQRRLYGQDIHSLPRPLGRPLPAANPPSTSQTDLNFSAQRARPRSSLQPLTLAEIHNRLSLLQACKYGDLTRVSTLLFQGVDPNTREFSASSWLQNGAAAIHIATIEGHYDVVRILLHHGARVDEPFRGFQRPLHESVRRGDSALTVLLLDNGAKVDARDERGYQPLHVAVMAGNVTCARLLIWAGAPVNAVGNDFLTPLHHVAMAGGSSSSIAVEGRNGADGSGGNMDLVELLVEHGADVLVRTRWLLGNKLASEIAREKGFVEMEHRLQALESAASIQ